MIWNDFIQKIKDYRKTCAAGQVNLNAISLITLIYVGAFDSMIDTLPSLNIYRRMTKELMDALESTAKLPVAKKGEAYGIADIDSDLTLNMWRSQYNPLYSFDFSQYCHNVLDKKHFKKNKPNILTYPHPNKISYFSKDFDLWESWSFIFDHPECLKHYSPPKNDPANRFRRAPAFLGIVKTSELKLLKDGRESLVFTLFLGQEETGQIRVWPNKRSREDIDKDNIVDKRLRSLLKPGALGYAIVRLQDLNGYKSATLLQWVPLKIINIEGSNEIA